MENTPLPEAMEFDTMEELDALASPFRLRILEGFTSPATIRACAEAMGVAPTRLYRHVHRLVEFGFLEMVEERSVGRTTERVYRAAGRSIRPSDEFLGRYGAEGARELFRLVFRIVESEVLETGRDVDLSERNGLVALSHSRLYLSEDHLRELVEALSEIIEKYGKVSGDIEVSVLASAVPLNLEEGRSGRR